MHAFRDIEEAVDGVDIYLVFVDPASSGIQLGCVVVVADQDLIDIAGVNQPAVFADLFGWQEFAANVKGIPFLNVTGKVAQFITPGTPGRQLHGEVFAADMFDVHLDLKKMRNGSGAEILYFIVENSENKPG
jgi:hypothetical protein